MEDKKITKICIITTIPKTIKSFLLKSAVYIHEQTGWDISFISSYDEDFANSIPEYIHYYPVEMKRGVNLDGIKVIQQMESIFKRERFDIVQYSTPNASMYASIAAKRCGVKIRNYHLMGYRYFGAQGMSRRILKRIEMITCKNSTSIECVSQSNLEIGVKEGLFDREKATVIWHGSTGGVDRTRFDYSKRKEWRKEIRESLGCSEDDFIFGFCGRITRDKGVNELLESYFSLNDNSKLMMIGQEENSDGGIKPDLINRAKNHKNILFIGKVMEAKKYYAAMDVLVLPTYREGFGNVIIEAAAVGTPSIVSRIPGPVDAVVPDKTALLVEPKDVDSLLSAMREIRKKDYVAMGNNAYQNAKDCFDSEEMNKYILERKLELLNAAEK